MGLIDKLGAEVDEDSIVGWRPKKRMTKEERLEAVLGGRGPTNAKQKGGGSTNKEKLRNKPFLLVKHSEKNKRKKERSFSDQQEQRVAHLNTMKKMGKKAKNQIKRKKMARKA